MTPHWGIAFYSSSIGTTHRDSDREMSWDPEIRDWPPDRRGRYFGHHSHYCSKGAGEVGVVDGDNGHGFGVGGGGSGCGWNAEVEGD